LTRRALSPHLSLALLLVAVLLPLPVLPRLNADNAPETYFPPEAPALVIERELRQRFPGDAVLIGLFEGPELFGETVLAALHRVAMQIEAHPLVDRVLAVTTLDSIAPIPEGFEVRPLIDPAGLAEGDAEGRRRQALADRFAPGLVVAEDGSALAVVVRVEKLDDSRQRVAVLDAFHDAVAQAGLRGYLTAVAGDVVLDAELFRTVQRENSLFVPLTSAAGLLLLCWMIPRWRALALGLLAMGAVIASPLLLYAVTGWPYNAVAGILPPLMSALTVALLIHLFNGVLHAERRGHRGGERVWQAVSAVRRPARYTTLTTAVGFGSLALSPMRPIAHFGLAAALGMGALYLVVMVLLPPVLARWAPQPWRSRRAGMEPVAWVAQRLAALAMRRAALVVALFVVAVLLAVSYVWQVKVDSDIYEFFPRNHPLIAATERVEERLSGVMPLEVIFDGPGRDSLLDPARLRAVEAFQSWAETLPTVDRSFSMVDVLQEMHAAFHGGDPTARALPARQPLISQYLLIYDGEDLYELVDRDLQRTRVILTLNAHRAREIGAVMDRIRAYLKAAELGDLTWELAGASRIFADYEALLVRGQVLSLSAAVTVIFLIMVLLWRSLGAAALTMLPNLSPALVMFAVMGAAGIWLDVATAIIACVAVGIAVDDTIHFYEGYRSRRARGARLSWALARSYRQAGRAVTATTAILVLQFGLLSFSGFVPMKQFGFLTALGLLAALLFDLLLLPALLVLAHAARRELALPAPRLSREVER
jgi:uncharacterized protein